MFESLTEHTTDEAIAEAWFIGENLGVYEFNVLVGRGMSDEEALERVRHVHGLSAEDRVQYWHELMDRLQSDKDRA